MLLVIWATPANCQVFINTCAKCHKPPVNANKTVVKRIVTIAVNKKQTGCIQSFKSERFIKALSSGRIVVKKGDKLSCLAQKIYGNANDWFLIAIENGIDTSKPRHIYPGESLRVPIKKLGMASRQCGKVRVSASSLQVAIAESKGVKQIVESEVKVNTVTSITFGQFTSSSRGENRNEKKQDSELAVGVTENFPEPSSVLGSLLDKSFYLKDYYSLTKLEEKQNNVDNSKPVFNQSSTAKHDTKGTQKPHKFEMYVAAEKYKDDGGAKAIENHYSAKIAFKPFSYRLSDSITGNFGVFGYAAGSHGWVNDSNQNEFEYGTKEVAFGLSNKLYGKHWYYGIDLGVGRLWFDGGSRISQTQNQQTDDSLYIWQNAGFYHRRDKGIKSFSLTEVSFELRQPLRSESVNYGTSPINNATVSGSIFQGIYDISLWSQLRLTPGFNLGGGRDGSTSSMFARFGPGVALYDENDQMFKFDLFNYKVNIGRRGRWYTFAGSISPHIIWKTTYGMLIREVSPANVPSLFSK
ncbi:hypothetical protein HGA64_01690 [Candidatus Falkowbacteria bacterium]|nr:hypothetical protein [Candidatus Falkowbacteria bacterium]